MLRAASSFFWMKLGLAMRMSDMLSTTEPALLSRDAFSSAAAAGYYAMSRFGSDLGVDTGLPGACIVRLVAADCGSHCHSHCCTYHPMKTVL